jgi:outer membrane receptor protein involved in Fe transport
LRSPVQIPTSRQLEFTLGLPILHEDVSVHGGDRSRRRAHAPGAAVNIIDADEIALRAKSAVVEAASEEVGLHVQRTSPVMSGIFVRGLTGNKVNVFVDGVRYSTAAQRGGVNTFLNLIDPALLQSLEVLRGPSSAQYGSDALGGSLQFLSRVPSIGVTNGRRASALLSASVNSADHGVGGNLSGSFAGARFGVFGGVAGRNIGDLRPGDGVDSHAAVTRFPRHPIGSADAITSARHRVRSIRSPGVGQLAPRSERPPRHLVPQGRQNDGKRYDQLLGGDGKSRRGSSRSRARSRVRPLRTPAGGLVWTSVGDRRCELAARRAREPGRQRQSARGDQQRAGADHRRQHPGDRAEATVDGDGARFGGDFHPERITAPSTSLNPVTVRRRPARPRPRRRDIRSGGVFAQVELRRCPVEAALRRQRTHERRVLSGARVGQSARQRPAAVAERRAERERHCISRRHDADARRTPSRSRRM